MSQIINTRADLDALAKSDPAAHAEFVKYLKGSLTLTTDIRAYPKEYPRDTTKVGDAGYLAPVLGDKADDSCAARFKFTRGELLNSAPAK